MKRQLIYHTHVNTSLFNKIEVGIKTDQISTSCYLDRVSRIGITLTCDTETLHKIMPNKASVAPKDPITLTTFFALAQNIEAKCRVIFARRLSKDQFVIELKFVDISERAMQHLDDYIEKNMSLEAKGKQKILDKPLNKLHSLASDVYQINKELKLTYSKVA